MHRSPLACSRVEAAALSGLSQRQVHIFRRMLFEISETAKTADRACNH